MTLVDWLLDQCMAMGNEPTHPPGFCKVHRYAKEWNGLLMIGCVAQRLSFNGFSCSLMIINATNTCLTLCSLYCSLTFITTFTSYLRSALVHNLHLIVTHPSCIIHLLNILTLRKALTILSSILTHVHIHMHIHTYSNFNTINIDLCPYSKETTSNFRTIIWA